MNHLLAENALKLTVPQLAYYSQVSLNLHFRNFYRISIKLPNLTPKISLSLIVLNLYILNLDTSV